MNENSLIRDIGRSFIISSLVPAALFATIAALLFKDFFPFLLTARLNSNDPLFADISHWLLLSLTIFWLGFGLYSAWNWIVKLYEGYFMPAWLAERMKDRLYYEKFKRMKNIKEYKEMGEQLANKEVTNDTYTKKYLQALEDAQVLELYYPPEKEDFLPTRLGNILRASEIYPWKRYRMEGVTLFSRLVHLFPSSFANQMEEQNNKFIFLLNSSFLSLVMGCICWILVLMRSPCYVLHPRFLSGGLHFYASFVCTDGVPNTFFQQGFSSITETKYFFIGLIFMIAGYGIYRISLIAANAYTRLVRTGFDLYRFDLIKQLKQPLESNLEQEREGWRQISEFLIASDDLGYVNFKYKLESEEPPQKRESSNHLLINLFSWYRKNSSH